MPRVALRASCRAVMTRSGFPSLAEGLASRRPGRSAFNPLGILSRRYVADTAQGAALRCIVGSICNRLLRALQAFRTRKAESSAWRPALKRRRGVTLLQALDGSLAPSELFLFDPMLVSL